jgi:hypothetical protein
MQVTIKPGFSRIQDSTEGLRIESKGIMIDYGRPMIQ